MEFIQGSTYNLEINLKDDNGAPIDINDVEKVQFIVGDVEKQYPGMGVAYNADKKTFTITLTQEDTFKLQGTVKRQTRVKHKDGSVTGSIPTLDYVYESLSMVVL